MNNYNEDLERAIALSREGANLNFAADALTEITGLQGKPEARKRLIAIAGLDTAQSFGAPDIPSKIQVLQEKLYSEAPAENNAEFHEGMNAVRDFEDNGIIRSLVAAHESMLEEEEAEKRRAVEAAAKAMRNAEDAAAHKNAEAKSARNKWLSRFNKKGRRSSSNSRKSNRKTRKNRKNRRLTRRTK